MKIRNDIHKNEDTYNVYHCDGINRLGIKVPRGFKEEFKKIKDILPDCTNKGLWVSNAGYVYNARKDAFPGYYNTPGYGYRFLTLHFGTCQRSFGIHHLVARAFCDKPVSDSKLVVNHKDENRLNNVYSNLEWCTYKENSNYGTANVRLSKSLKAAWDRDTDHNRRTGTRVRVNNIGFNKIYKSVREACIDITGSANASGAINKRLQKDFVTIYKGYLFTRL